MWQHGEEEVDESKMELDRLRVASDQLWQCRACRGPDEKEESRGRKGVQSSRGASRALRGRVGAFEG